MTTVGRGMTALRRRAVLTMAGSVIGLAGAVSVGAARAQSRGELVDLAVVDRESGQAMRVWRHDGRLFVAGQPGARYALRVTNNTDGRVLVVMSVDGINVLTGETAGYGQRGYVFYPRQSYDVSGWRKSDSEVAAFTFAPLPQSYAARTGRPGEVGVIGIAAFRERAMAPIPIAPAASKALPQPASPPAADAVVAAERRSEKLGTAHGAREWSVVTNAPFERATRYPQLVRRIEYDSYDNLAANGVIPRPWEFRRRPRPFPSSPDGEGYVPDPPGRP